MKPRLTVAADLRTSFGSEWGPFYTETARFGVNTEATCREFDPAWFRGDAYGWNTHPSDARDPSDPSGAPYRVRVIHLPRPLLVVSSRVWYRLCLVPRLMRQHSGPGCSRLPGRLGREPSPNLEGPTYKHTLLSYDTRWGQRHRGQTHETQGPCDLFTFSRYRRY